METEFGIGAWLLAVVAATGIGISKSGLPGIGLVHVAIFAHLFPGLASTGVVLPMLVAGDIGAVILFRRQADVSHLVRTLPPAAAGVVFGWLLMGWMQRGGIAAVHFNPIIGGIVLLLALAQLLRDWRPDLYAGVPHTRRFAWTMGFIAGVTTMLANAAGPVMGLYLLAVALPKETYVGTAAWFFLIINALKLPFSAHLGLIHSSSLWFNLKLIPAVIAGLWMGRSVVARVPQKGFDSLVLAFALAAAVKLLASG